MLWVLYFISVRIDSLTLVNAMAKASYRILRLYLLSWTRPSKPRALSISKEDK
jgi:hypothetical protein